MLEAFQQFISKYKLIQPEERVLLAVSGGLDSIVMSSLFHQSNIPFAIVHCNFGLRENESDGDEAFVKTLAKKYAIPFFCQSFEIKGYANKHAVSIQMAARELRYNWFSVLMKNEGYSKIATAHHQTDLLETQLINFSRGTGVSGMKGFQPITENIIRPLLFATREELLKYASDNNLEYREDSSNASDKYTRNKIRHHVLPILREINPSIENTAWENASRFSQAEMLTEWAINQFREKYISIADDKIVIELQDILSQAFSGIILYKLLSEYGFNNSQVEDLLSNSLSGRQFDSANYRLITDRSRLLIMLKTQENEQIVLPVDLNIATNSFPDFSLKINRHKNATDFAIPRSSTIVCIDAGKLQTPIEIRKWQHGDFFYPLGMNKRKLLSDFFIDNKLSAIDKEDVWLLTSNGQVVWIMEYRIDDRFKITADTQDIIVLEIDK